MTTPPVKSAYVRVTGYHPCREFPGWWAEFWECGHGSVRPWSGVSARRNCRVCILLLNRPGTARVAA